MKLIRNRNLVAYCRRYSRYSYLHDPDTGCISTRRIVIQSCSGSCKHPSITSLLWYREQQRKRRWRKKARRRIRRHRRQWTPQPSTPVANSPLPALSVLLRPPRSTPSGETCCRPIRFKQRSVQFHCPQNPTGRMYSRWFRFVRKCGCTACPNVGEVVEKNAVPLR